MQEKFTFASKVKCFRKIQDISVMCLRNNITSNPRIFSKYRYVQNILLHIRGTLLSQTEHIDIVSNQPCRKAVPNFIGTRDWFPGRQFFHRQGFGEGFRMIQVHYIYCALYFYYYYINSASDQQALSPGSWGTLVQDVFVSSL